MVIKRQIGVVSWLSELNQELLFIYPIGK